MIDCLNIIEDFLLLQREFYDLTIKEDFYYQRILNNINKLRKEYLKYEKYI